MAYHARNFQYVPVVLLITYRSGPQWQITALGELALLKYQVGLFIFSIN
jgi:hypothetical protein